MTNRNTKYWFFTWETNAVQKKLPDESRLKTFLDQIADYAQFQKEKGAKKGTLHYQGCLELTGTRQSKKILLEMFKSTFKNVGGLTLSKVFSKNAVLDYTSKQETKVSETIYCGRKEMFSTEIQQLCNKEWQREMFQFLLTIKDETITDSERFKKRGIIWVEDPDGGHGKSEFITWLRAGQKKLICRLLPMDSVDRLIHAVIEITSREKVDVFMIDDTRTAGENTSFKDMFEAIERVKNGHLVSTFYGKYSESIFKRPQIIFFTNRYLIDYTPHLSQDRWFQANLQHGHLNLIGWVDRNKYKPFVVGEMENIKVRGDDPDPYENILKQMY